VASQRTGTWILTAAIVGSSMSQIDGTAVNVALPTLQRELGASGAELQWVIEGYALFLSALILIGGSLGDLFGRRRVFAIGIALFAAASLACALAPNVGLLILARCVQGIGGALATPGSLSLVSAYFQGAERGKAIGTWSAFGAATSALGPVLGGYLAQHASWRWVFLVNLPLAVGVLAILVFRVPESRDEQATRRVDWTGAALATLGLGFLVYGFIDLQNPVHGAAAFACIALGVVLLAGFVIAEQRERTPMMPLGIFRSRTFAAANLYTFALYGALGGALYFLPFDLQNVQGYSPTVAGTALLPFVVTMVVLSRFTGGLYGRIGARMPLAVGAIVAGIGFLAFARIGIGGSYWTTFFVPALLLGIGAAFFVAPLTTAVFDAAPVAESGLASGINNAISRSAALVAVAVLGVVLAAFFTPAFERGIDASRLSPAARAVAKAERASIVTGIVPAAIARADRPVLDRIVRTSYVGGFRAVMIVAALLAFLAAALAVLLIAPHPHAP
jgi:EmrB/QacA subfamily drug resistance transporter